MVTKVHLAITLLVIAVTVPTPATSKTGDISATPDNRVTPSTDVSLQCSVDTAQYPGAYILWRKQTGSVSIRLGTNNGLDEAWISSRYSLNGQKSGGIDTFTLTIKDAKYEDSGTYICQRGYSGTEGVASSLSLAVCDDTDSPSCKCTDTEGWSSPSCFEQPEEAQAIIDRYKGAIIGVVVCLVIAILYGVVVSVMLSRDCLNRMRLKAKKKLDAIQSESSLDRRHLNDSSEIQGDGATQENNSGLYHVPHRVPYQSDHVGGGSSYYEEAPLTHEVSVHDHHHQQPQPSPQQLHHHNRDHHRPGGGRQEHVNKAFNINDEEKKSYNQLKPPTHDIQQQRGTTPSSHSPGVSDSSTDSWGLQGARPKTSHQKKPSPHYTTLTTTTPDTTSRYNHPHQSGTHSPRQTGRQNLPQAGSHSSRPAAAVPDTTNQEPVQKMSRPKATIAAATHSSDEQEYQQLQHKKRQAPYPGQDNNNSNTTTPYTGQDRVPAKYDTYASDLPTVSQQIPANPTPKSTHSEHLATSTPIGGGMEMSAQRGAYTDGITHDHSKGDQRNGYPSARGHYTQPRKLDYVNGRVTNNPKGAAYVSERDTII